MSENINGIEIEGGCFESATKLEFFDKKFDKKEKKQYKNIAIIYGANGSGKSSIANAILEYSKNNTRKFEVNLLDKNNNIIIKPEVKYNFYIFNEKFINENVKFKDDGKLNSIVLLGAVKEITEAIDKLKKQKEQINTNIKILNSLSKNLAFDNFKNIGIIYENDKQSSISKELFKLNVELKSINTKINILNNKIKNIDLETNLINNYLSYIFLGDNSLKIESEDNKYIVKINNKTIKLNDLSEGEKNAIALCYFLSIIKRNHSLKKEYFIILDDPISSFDFNNKIGIYTLLRYILNKIEVYNPKSCILIFTHQIEAMFHLCKVYKDIKKSCPNYLILNNHKLKTFDKNNEYSELLNTIFNYANGDNNNNSENIGNSMRRVIESFSCFNYNISTEELFNDENILKLIDDNNKKEYFKNLMIRLVLNSESHLADQTKLITQNGLYKYISAEEKKKTAKLLLVFFKILNKLHLQKHLYNQKNIEIIEKWEKELFPDKKYLKDPIL